jgi:hypothetical protein
MWHRLFVLGTMAALACSIMWMTTRPAGLVSAQVPEGCAGEQALGSHCVGPFVQSDIQLHQQSKPLAHRTLATIRAGNCHAAKQLAGLIGSARFGFSSALASRWSISPRIRSLGRAASPFASGPGDAKPLTDT